MRAGVRKGTECERANGFAIFSAERCEQGCDVIKDVE